MTELRFGVIGWGYWGPKVARNLDTLPRAAVTRVADLDAQTFTLDGFETLGRGRNDIRARRKIGEAVVAACICLDFLAADQRGTRQHHVSMGHESPRGILHRAL